MAGSRVWLDRTRRLDNEREPDAFLQRQPVLGEASPCEGARVDESRWVVEYIRYNRPRQCFSEVAQRYGAVGGDSDCRGAQTGKHGYCL